MREAGATAVQEVAFTFADGLEYVRRAVALGLDVNELAARLSFFFAAFTDLFEEVAKFRAARRLWARLMKGNFGAADFGTPLRRLPRPNSPSSAAPTAAATQSTRPNSSYLPAPSAV